MKLTNGTHQNVVGHSEKKCFAFGSSTPRDFSYLQNIPMFLRTYDSRPYAERSRSRKSLAHYMREARSITRNNSAHRNDSFERNKIIAFGSSAPRSFGHMSTSRSQQPSSEMRSIYRHRSRTTRMLSDNCSKQEASTTKLKNIEKESIEDKNCGQGRRVSAEESKSNNAYKPYKLTPKNESKRTVNSYHEASAPTSPCVRGTEAYICGLRGSTEIAQSISPQSFSNAENIDGYLSLPKEYGSDLNVKESLKSQENQQTVMIENLRMHQSHAAYRQDNGQIDNSTFTVQAISGMESAKSPDVYSTRNESLYESYAANTDKNDYEENSYHIKMSEIPIFNNQDADKLDMGAVASDGEQVFEAAVDTERILEPSFEVIAHEKLKDTIVSHEGSNEEGKIMKSVESVPYTDLMQDDSPIHMKNSLIVIQTAPDAEAMMTERGEGFVADDEENVENERLHEDRFSEQHDYRLTSASPVAPTLMPLSRDEAYEAVIVSHDKLISKLQHHQEYIEHINSSAHRVDMSISAQDSNQIAHTQDAEDEEYISIVYQDNDSEIKSIELQNEITLEEKSDNIAKCMEYSEYSSDIEKVYSKLSGSETQVYDHKTEAYQPQIEESGQVLRYHADLDRDNPNYLCHEEEKSVNQMGCTVIPVREIAETDEVESLETGIEKVLSDSMYYSDHPVDFSENSKPFQERSMTIDVDLDAVELALPVTTPIIMDEKINVLGPLTIVHSLVDRSTSETITYSASIPKDVNLMETDNYAQTRTTAEEPNSEISQKIGISQLSITGFERECVDEPCTVFPDSEIAYELHEAHKSNMADLDEAEKLNYDEINEKQYSTLTLAYDEMCRSPLFNRADLIESQNATLKNQSENTTDSHIDDLIRIADVKGICEEDVDSFVCNNSDTVHAIQPTITEPEQVIIFASITKHDHSNNGFDIIDANKEDASANRANDDYGAVKVLKISTQPYEVSTVESITSELKNMTKNIALSHEHLDEENIMLNVHDTGELDGIFTADSEAAAKSASYIVEESCDTDAIVTQVLHRAINMNELDSDQEFVIDSTEISSNSSKYQRWKETGRKLSFGDEISPDSGSSMIVNDVDKNYAQEEKNYALSEADEEDRNMNESDIQDESYDNLAIQNLQKKHDIDGTPFNNLLHGGLPDTNDNISVSFSTVE